MADKTYALNQYGAVSGQKIAVPLGSEQTLKLTRSASLQFLSAWVISSERIDAAAINSLLELVASDRTKARELEKQLFSPGNAGQGGGFPISPDGYFLTAAHVVRYSKCSVAYLDASAPTVIRFTDARLVHRDDVTDVALLKIEKATPRFLEVTGPRSHTAGEVLLAGRLGGKPTAGEVIESRMLPSKNADGAEFQRLKLLMPVMPGDSGAPVIDADGRLCGMVIQEIYGRFWTRPHRANAVMPEGTYVARLIAKDREEQRVKALTPSR